MTNFHRPLSVVGTMIALVLLLAGCAKERIVKVPDAENILFTDSGRLIVSGGQNIYEVISPSAGQYEVVALYDGQCVFTGIAQWQDWLFTACTRWFPRPPGRYLLAAQLQGDGPPQFEIIHELQGFFVPNGLAFDSVGHLLVADEYFLAPGGVARLQIAMGNPPQVIEVDKEWLGPEQGVSSANGVRVSGNELFLTDGGDLKRFTLDQEGNVMDQVLLVSRPTILDDLWPACGGAIVTDFLNGQLFYVDASGEIVAESRRFAFAFPSAVRFGEGPLFTDHQLLITEKGILYEQQSNFGNHLVKVDVDVDPAVVATYCR